MRLVIQDRINDRGCACLAIPDQIADRAGDGVEKGFDMGHGEFLSPSNILGLAKLAIANILDT